ncbi:MAG: PIN domain-containing protein [Halobacteriovoraceae bacterium]|nr:PIN domain-containing protein [Halobacteriovoraceae bacterium]
MCVIIDANMFGPYLKSNDQGMKFLKEWIEEHGGKITYSPTSSLKSEWNKSPNMWQLMVKYRERGKLKHIDKHKVEIIQKELLKKHDLKSNDSHIIALAMAAKVKVLVSKDQNLIEDFKNIIKGKTYKGTQQKKLLRKDTCP